MAAAKVCTSLAIFFFVCFSSSESIGMFTHRTFVTDGPLRSFTEAPEYRNADICSTSTAASSSASDGDTCDPSDVHIAMTLDRRYLRGTIAAVHSILRHTSCPNSVFFHFFASPESTLSLSFLLRSTFTSLKFKIYPFSKDQVSGLISPSTIRFALDNPLNYVRNYIADIVESCVTRVIYLDSDVVVVDDIQTLWSTNIPEPTVIAAPEYCHANFTNYFTDAFWADPKLSSVFTRRKDNYDSEPCYFNTGVMVMDLARWRRGFYGERIRRWMMVQKRGRPRIYELGSLPPLLLVFAGKIKAVEHRWNQHGLGGDNADGNCRNLHPGPTSLLHWSGKGKPWVRLDAGSPCSVDHLWAPYDLYIKQYNTH